MEETHLQYTQIDQPPAKKAKIARVRYPNWGKRETIILVKAYQRQIDEFATATSKGRMATNEQKWDKISSMCGKEGVARDAEQCRKRWQDLSKNYKRIKDWEVLEEESFWLLPLSLRKDKNLPGTFDKEVYDYMDSFVGPKAGVPLHRLLSTKARCVSVDDHQDIACGSLDGRTSAMLTYVEQESHADRSLQEDSWALSKEQILPAVYHRKNTQSSQADSRSDPIIEALESATRLVQEQCSAQLTEVLAEVLSKLADAMKTVAENLRKQLR